MTKKFLLHTSCCSALLLGAAVVAGADEVKLPWQSSGVYYKVNYFVPQHLTLSPEKPGAIKAVPADVTAPLYGQLQLGSSDAPTTFYLLVDEPEGKPARLFVDANANGDLTDDPPIEWKPRNVKTTDDALLTNYSGGADLHLAYGSDKVTLHLGLYRFDPHDPSRADHANDLYFYRDYGRVGEISLGGATYKAALVDDTVTGDFRPAHDSTKSAVNLLIDTNNNGKFELPGESFNVGEPFKIAGATYEITGLDASGASFQIVKSDKKVPDAAPREPHAPRVHLSVGAKALAFEATNTDGNAIHFPVSYKGKLVLLDFWATWCGPCRGEVPHLSAAYEKYHDKGFEVLGVSLDQPNSSEMLAKFTKENHMPWPEIYDSKNGQPAVAQTYAISSIPHPFLVDGDTGKIVAEGETLRGDTLPTTLENAFKRRNGEVVDLTAGAKTPPFEAKTTDGETVHFPDKYKGKLVLLDFWATWCPPCRGEIPHVAAAYEKYHAKGFEVLGVSLDKAGDGEMLAKFTKENKMPWPEIYDGLGWKSAVGQVYSINSIPHAFLVDGDTGKIVAEGNEIRGEGLATAVEEALAKHQ